MGSVKILKEKDMVKRIEVNPDILLSQYILYIKAKSHVIPFLQQSKTEYKEIGDIIFTDIQELAQTTRIKEKRYYVSFTDGTT